MNISLVNAGFTELEWVQFTNNLLPIKFNDADLTADGVWESNDFINLGSIVYVAKNVLPIEPRKTDI